MSPRFLQACQSLQSAEKACWDILLREHPDAGVYSEELLNAAMDRTLEQLWSLLSAGPVRERLQEVRTTPPPLPTDQECALTTHLPYFNAGERALELIADELARSDPAFGGPTHQRQRAELCAAFHALVQCQLEAICDHCQHAGECRYGDWKSVAGLPAAAEPAPESSSARNGRSAAPARRARRRRRTAP